MVDQNILTTIADAVQTIFKLPVSQKKIMEDFHILDDFSKSTQGQIIPFEIEDLERIAHKWSLVKKSKRSKPILCGVFDSIYYEHLFVFGLRIHNDKQRSILIKTSKDSYFITKNLKESIIYIDNKLAGFINSKNQLLDNKQNVLAEIKTKSEASSYIIQKNTYPIAQVQVLNQKLRQSNRMVQLLHKTTADDAELILILMVYQIFVDYQW